MPENPELFRLAAFLSVSAVMALSETVWPRRQLTVSKLQRWRGNVAIIIINSLLIRLVSPVAPYAMATVASANGWGLFPLLKLSGMPVLVITVLLLDLIIYWQHRTFHRIPFFWRIHRMHHTDLDLDVSSGARFHPFEIILSLAIKTVAVLLLGASPYAVLLFETILNSTSMFNHANLRIPASVDRLLRMVLVTPDMHRVHHSVIPRETDSNFGFSVSWWDRLSGTYRAEPRDRHERMTIGLKEYRDLDQLGLRQLLTLPFVNLKSGRTP